MGTFESFLSSKKISIEELASASQRIEAHSKSSRAQLVKRAQKRRDKDAAAKSYADMGLAKPPTSGRAVTPALLHAAVAGRPLTRKSRGKILRAVGVVLAKRKEAPADMKALFDESKARVGKKPVKAEGKK